MKQTKAKRQFPKNTECLTLNINNISEWHAHKPRIKSHLLAQRPNNVVYIFTDKDNYRTLRAHATLMAELFYNHTANYHHYKVLADEKLHRITITNIS